MQLSNFCGVGQQVKSFSFYYLGTLMVEPHAQDKGTEKLNHWPQVTQLRGGAVPPWPCLALGDRLRSRATGRVPFIPSPHTPSWDLHPIPPTLKVLPRLPGTGEATLGRAGGCTHPARSLPLSIVFHCR